MAECVNFASLFIIIGFPVPAKIIEHLSTEDLVVRENEKVTLVCNVTGVPMPEVTWYRHVNYQKGVEKQSEFCPSTDRKQSVMCFFSFCVLCVHPSVTLPVRPRSCYRFHVSCCPWLYPGHLPLPLPPPTLLCSSPTSSNSFFVLLLSVCLLPYIIQ